MTRVQVLFGKSSILVSPSLGHVEAGVGAVSRRRAGNAQQKADAVLPAFAGPGAFAPLSQTVRTGF